MRIVQFIDTLRSGGKERQLVELLKGLAVESDTEVELITMSDSIHYTYLHDLKIKIHKLVRKSQKDPFIFWQLYHLLKKIQPDILHSWGSMCSVYALPAVKFLGITFVNGFLRNAPPSLGMRDRAWRRSKLTFPFSDAIVANSRAGLKAYDAPAAKSFCIYNGFDPSRIDNIESVEKVRQRYNITTRYVVGMVATFSANKDFFTFINAAQKILETRKDVTFVAAGDGPNLSLCREQVKKINQPFIVFPGRLKDVECLMKIFDIGVLTSNATIHGEGISNTVMEYMALGKPAIATDCGGNSELIVDSVTGYLVENGDVNKLIERILFFIEHSNIAEEMGMAGADRLSEVFSLQKMTESYLDLYNQLLVGK